VKMRAGKTWWLSTAAIFVRQGIINGNMGKQWVYQWNIHPAYPLVI
jgi:hypothetical protein